MMFIKVGEQMLSGLDDLNPGRLAIQQDESMRGQDLTSTQGNTIIDTGTGTISPDRTCSYRFSKL